MDETREDVLAGGNMEPVVRVGDTVRRTTGAWTPAVHELLRRCEDAGIGEAPRVLGTDETGREILTFIPGEVMTDLSPAAQWSPHLLRAAGALLRRLHDASEPIVDAKLTWRQPRREPAEVVCHNDFAPYNLIVDGDRLVGVIDFDMASPGSRLWDIAYLAYRLAPYAEDAAGFDAGRHGTCADRLTELLDAYGIDCPHDEVRHTAARRLDALAEFTKDRADETGRSDLAGHAAMYRRDARRLRRE